MDERPEHEPRRRRRLRHWLVPWRDDPWNLFLAEASWVLLVAEIVVSIGVGFFVSLFVHTGPDAIAFGVSGGCAALFFQAGMRGVIIREEHGFFCGSYALAWVNGVLLLFYLIWLLDSLPYYFRWT